MSPSGKRSGSGFASLLTKEPWQPHWMVWSLIEGLLRLSPSPLIQEWTLSRGQCLTPSPATVPRSPSISANLTLLEPLPVLAPITGPQVKQCPEGLRVASPYQPTGQTGSQTAGQPDSFTATQGRITRAGTMLSRTPSSLACDTSSPLGLSFVKTAGSATPAILSVS